MSGSLIDKYRSSLAIKMMGVFFIAVSAGLLSLLVLLWYWDRDYEEQNYAADLAKWAQVIVSHIGTPPDYQRAEHLANDLVTDIYITSADGVWSSNGQPVTDALQQSVYEPFDNLSTDAIAFGYFYGEDSALNTRWQGPEHAVYIAEGPDFVDPIDQRPILLAFAGAMLIILIFFYAMSRRFISPLHRIRASIQRYSTGDLTQRIQLTRSDEFGQLANQIDSMTDEIQSILESKRQLLLAISHELRTPLTRANISLAMLEESDYKAEVKSDLQQMDSLIEALLEGERLGMSHQVLNITQSSANKLLQDVVGSYPTVAIELQPLETDVDIDADTVRVELLLRNLITNAVRYGGQSGKDSAVPIQLRVAIENENLVLSVIDSGEGIAKEQLVQLAEPFFRVESSRQHSSGGYGVGLYLCRMIAEAHNGTLKMSSVLGKGTMVSAYLPVLSPHEK